MVKGRKDLIGHKLVCWNIANIVLSQEEDDYFARSYILMYSSKLNHNIRL